MNPIAACFTRTAAFALAASLLWAIACPSRAAETQPDLVLRGELAGKDHQTYRTVPFAVPAGTARITVQFEYTGRDSKTTIDLGLLGPDGFRGQDGFRGWSGGNKALFTVSATDATPSYLPGRSVRGGGRCCSAFPTSARTCVPNSPRASGSVAKASPTGYRRSPTRRCATKPAGTAAICTCTTRTATAAARTRPARRCLAPCS